MKNIYIPTKDILSWIPFLASEKHWKKGRSAMSIAEAWEKSNGIPIEITNVLSQNISFRNPELLLAIPEYIVPLKGQGKGSQNDVLAVFSNLEGLSVMTIEGKVTEGFDKTISAWKKEATNDNRQIRLNYILDKIGIEEKGIEHLRYQIFHRLASAVIMAEKYHAKNALMVIQSFSDDDSENGFSDFADFLKIYEINDVEKHKLYKLKDLNGIQLYATWVYCDWEKYAVK